MKLHTIRITNFRSFKGEQSFHFPEKPGLYFMQGINEAESRLEGNGAGKSTIWEALLWCFFAKTSRGLKAGDVCNWDVDKGAKVEVDFSFDEHTLWTTQRTWKPNSWTLSHISDHITDEEVIDLTKSESNPVLSWLNLEFAPFLHCILMAQSQPMFLDLAHDRQAALFSEVLGLDHWIDYSKRASLKASAQDAETRRLERKLSEVIGQINGQQDFKGSVEQFEADREAKLQKFDQPYREKIAQLRVMRGHEEDAKELEAKRRAELKLLVADLNDVVTNSIDPRAKAVAEATRELERAEDRLDQAERAFTRLDKGKDCPTCKRPLDSRDHASHLKQAEEDVAQLLKQFNKAEDVLKAAKRKLDEVEKENLAILKGHAKASELLEVAEMSSKSQRQACERIERELDDIEHEVERLEKEVNPFLDVQSKAKEEGRRLRAERAELQDQVDVSSEKYQLYSFWVRGFKELRLQLIADALTELEIEVNSCVTALGLVGWELKFDVDRETKGGSIQRGFSVQVVSPLSTRPTPWEAWSGGESQRLRLAATMGLSNLIRARLGVGVDLEVWDEPSTALSPQGVRDLFETLEHRAIQESRVIWVVDHTAHAFGGFAGGATITKSKSGSSIQQY